MSDILTIDGAPTPGQENNLAPGMVGAPYTTTLTASGGNGEYQWTVDGTGTMPPGLALNRTGTIGGTPGPSAEGTQSITIQVGDGSTTATRTFSLRINSRALTIVGVSGSDGQNGLP